MKKGGEEEGGYFDHVDGLNDGGGDHSGCAAVDEGEGGFEEGVGEDVASAGGGTGGGAGGHGGGGEYSGEEGI